MKRIMMMMAMLVSVAGMAQSSINPDRADVRSILSIPRYSSLSNATAAGSKAGNLVYIHASADSGVYVRSMNNSRWILVNGVSGGGSGGNGIDSSAYRTMTQVADSIVTYNSLKRRDTLVVRVDKIDSLYNKPGQAKIYYQYAGVEYSVKDSVGPPSWRLGGNTGMGNFIGSLDENDFVIRRSNIEIASLGDNTLRFGYLTGTSPNSVYVGRNTGQGATLAGNTFTGHTAGQNATNVGASVYTGFESGFGATSATNSTFSGYQSGYQATGADGSIFSGYMAGRGATGARVSIFHGWQTGLNATAATYCILMGRNVGSNFTGNAIGRNNMIFGLNISLPNGSTDRFNFGNVLYGTGTYNSEGGDPSIAPTATGRVGIGVVTPTAVLDIRASTTLGAALRLRVSPAPSAPNDGDIWLESNTATGLKIRLNSTTYTINLL